MLALAIIATVLIAFQYFSIASHAKNGFDFFMFTCEKAFILVTIWILFNNLP